MPAAEWFCEIDGAQHGPVTAVQLKQLASAGKLKPTHPVWKEGMQSKVPARSVKGLFDGPASGSAPAAPRKPAAETKREDNLVEFEMVSDSGEGEDLMELETIEEEKPKKKPAPRKAKDEEDDIEEIEEEEEDEAEEEEEAEILAEEIVTYREGLPEMDGPLTAKLFVESVGLRFEFEDDDGTEFPVSFDKVESVLEPTKGDFPPAMKKKAMGAKAGAMMGKLASGLLGKMIGDSAGDLVSKVGGKASEMAAKAGDLGKPPRNRITIYARLRKKKCKVIFDVHGADREEMAEQAKAFYKQIEKARNRFAVAKEEAESAAVEEEAAEEEETVEEEQEEEVAEERTKPARMTGDLCSVGAALLAAAGTAARPFRLMRGGKVEGPYSFEELSGMITSGKVTAGDLIGVETWMSVVTLSGLVAAGSRPGETAAEEYGDYEEVTEDSPPPTAAPKSSAPAPAPAAAKPKALAASPPAEGESLPVDAEFQL